MILQTRLEDSRIIQTETKDPQHDEEYMHTGRDGVGVGNWTGGKDSGSGESRTGAVLTTQRDTEALTAGGLVRLLNPMTGRRVGVEEDEGIGCWLVQQKKVGLQGTGYLLPKAG